MSGAAESTTSSIPRRKPNPPTPSRSTATWIRRVAAGPWSGPRWMVRVPASHGVTPQKTSDWPKSIRQWGLCVWYRERLRSLPQDQHIIIRPDWPADWLGRPWLAVDAPFFDEDLDETDCYASQLEDVRVWTSAHLDEYGELSDEVHLTADLGFARDVEREPCIEYPDEAPSLRHSARPHPQRWLVRAGPLKRWTRRPVCRELLSESPERRLHRSPGLCLQGQPLCDVSERRTRMARDRRVLFEQHERRSNLDWRTESLPDGAVGSPSSAPMSRSSTIAETMIGRPQENLMRAASTLVFVSILEIHCSKAETSARHRPRHRSRHRR